MIPEPKRRPEKGPLPLKPYDVQCLKQVHDLILKDPTQPITMRALASEVGINRNKLHYGFKQEYGLSIHDFQVQLRLQKVKQLLATTHKSVKIIAAVTGFGNGSHLGEVFKRNYGVTPCAYRKKILSATSDDTSYMEDN